MSLYAQNRKSYGIHKATRGFHGNCQIAYYHEQMALRHIFSLASSMKSTSSMRGTERSREKTVRDTQQQNYTDDSRYIRSQKVE